MEFWHQWSLPSCRPYVSTYREFGTSAAYTSSSSGRRFEWQGIAVGEIKDTQTTNSVLNKLGKLGQLKEAMQVLDRVNDPHIRIHRQTYSALLQVREDSPEI